MKPAPLDLEQLRFFASLFETGALYKTRLEFDMSSAGASRALERLRQTFSDKLFVKSASGLTPTPAANELRPEIERAVAQLEALLAPRGFDPATSQRTFRIAANGFTFMAILADVLERCYRLAPRSGFEVVPFDETVFEKLRGGDLDLAIHPNTSLPADCHRLDLLELERSCLMREQHPLALRTPAGCPPDRDEFFRYRRLAVNFSTRHGHVSLDVEPNHSVEAGDVFLTTPYFLGTPYFLLRTDLIAVVPQRVAQHFSQIFPLAMLPLPEGERRIPGAGALVWHDRVHADPAVKWLRSVFADWKRECGSPIADAN